MTEFESALLGVSEAWDQAVQEKTSGERKLFPRTTLELLKGLNISPAMWVALFFITAKNLPIIRAVALMKAEELSMQVSPQIWFSAYLIGPLTGMGKLAKAQLMSWATEDPVKLSQLISGNFGNNGGNAGYYRTQRHRLNQRHTLPFWAMNQILNVELDNLQKVWLLSKYGELVHGQHKNKLLQLLIPDMKKIEKLETFPAK